MNWKNILFMFDENPIMQWHYAYLLHFYDMIWYGIHMIWYTIRCYEILWYGMVWYGMVCFAMRFE